MWHAHEFQFAGNHPTANGHFPGNPIIPGALLLDEVVAACTATLDRSRAVSIRSAKFLHPVRPGDPLRMQWRLVADGAISFECRLIDGDVLAASGTLQLATVPQ
jgi:3-hydroxyacyl-[acyl-carrier-protein] dehydratase